MQENCKHCDTMFKQKKNWRSHLAYVHGIDQIKEKHCEDDEQIIFKCKDCDLTFDYKRSLALHRKTKKEEKIMHECEFCESKFTYKNNLTKHVKLKHKK